MTNKTIFELDVAATVSTTDVVPIWQSANATGVAKKISVDQLRGAVVTTIPWANLTGDPMTNVEYKADWDAIQAQIAALSARITAVGTPILAQGAGGGSATPTAIPFPSGYNSTNCLLFTSLKQAIGAGTGSGLQTIQYTTTVTGSGWTVTPYARQEDGGGGVSYPQFTYFIIKSNVVPSNYNGVSSGGGSGGGVIPSSTGPGSLVFEPVEVPEYDPYNVT